jgi:DNA-binding NarL/FixJ family response regulator
MTSDSAASLRVLLVDDHPLVRAGIRSELERIASVKRIGEADDGRAALAFLKSQPVDIVFMDISMPELNGIDTTLRITREFPQVRVIVLSQHDNEEYLWRAIKAGAVGYLLKSAAIVELRDALARVLGGEIYLSRRLCCKLSTRSAWRANPRSRSPLEQLSSRQREILQLVAEGKNTKEIGHLLNVSHKTVEYHRTQLMGRLGIYDLAGLVRFAVGSGLVVPAL